MGNISLMKKNAAAFLTLLLTELVLMRIASASALRQEGMAWTNVTAAKANSCDTALTAGGSAAEYTHCYTTLVDKIVEPVAFDVELLHSMEKQINQLGLNFDAGNVDPFMFNERFKKILFLYFHQRDAEARHKDAQDDYLKQTKNPIPLIQAISDGDFQEVKDLVEKGSDVNVRGEYNGTPLTWAAWTENIDITKYLLAKGATLSPMDDFGSTALNYAEEVGSLPLVKALVEGGADVNQKDAKGDTPLQWLLHHKDGGPMDSAAPAIISYLHYIGAK